MLSKRVSMLSNRPFLLPQTAKMLTMGHITRSGGAFMRPGGRKMLPKRASLVKISATFCSNWVQGLPAGAELPRARSRPDRADDRRRRLRVDVEQFVLAHESIAQDEDVRALALVGHQQVRLHLPHALGQGVRRPGELLHTA